MVCWWEGDDATRKKYWCGWCTKHWAKTQLFYLQRRVPTLKRIVNLDENEASHERQSGIQTRNIKYYIAKFEWHNGNTKQHTCVFQHPMRVCVLTFLDWQPPLSFILLSPAGQKTRKKKKGQRPVRSLYRATYTTYPLISHTLYRGEREIFRSYLALVESRGY